MPKIVYGDSNGNTREIRVPYFYLHGELDEKNGSDFCSFSHFAIRACLQNRISVCNVNLEGTEYLEMGLIFSQWDGVKMNGWVVSIEDADGIKDALEEFPLAYQHIEDTDEKLLKVKYPGVYRMIVEHSQTR